MSDNFKKKVNDYYEDLSIVLLNKFSNIIKYERNNINNNDFDIIGKDKENRSILIDVQYSFDFAKYGDLRIDLMSAGSLKSNYMNYDVKILNKMINSSVDKYGKFKELMEIKRQGKFFDDRLSGVFYLIYNETNNTKSAEDYKKIKIDKIFFLPQAVIQKEIRESEDNTLIFKINDKKKNNINENYCSAFLCVNLLKLAKKYNLPIIENINELPKINKIIQIIHNYNIRNSETINIKTVKMKANI